MCTEESETKRGRNGERGISKCAANSFLFLSMLQVAFVLRQNLLVNLSRLIFGNLESLQDVLVVKFTRSFMETS